MQHLQGHRGRNSDAGEQLRARTQFLTPGVSSSGVENHTRASLAYLQDPLTMPPVLLKAHQALDKAVDKCYRPQAFANDAKRVFDL